MEIDKYKCAPGKNYENNSCFTIEDLIKLANDYNNNNNDQIIIKKDKKYLLKKLNEMMGKTYNCANQQCWLNITNDNNIKKYTFRPTGPTKKYEWLSTTDINAVMKQYEKKHTNFKFLEAVPYDFENLPQLEVYNINFDNLMKNNINKIGMVINLDNHDQSGSHWVSLFSSLDENKLYYFDSFGKTPGKRVRKFNKKIVKFMNKYFQDSSLLDNSTLKRGGDNSNRSTLDVRYNKIQHQFKNSECGVYSMNFIIRLLNGETFDHIVNTITKDDKMNDCRNAYFINNNNNSTNNLDYCNMNQI